MVLSLGRSDGTRPVTSGKERARRMDLELLKERRVQALATLPSGIEAAK
jgi:hypothetical protein